MTAIDETARIALSALLSVPPKSKTPPKLLSQVESEVTGLFVASGAVVDEVVSLEKERGNLYHLSGTFDPSITFTAELEATLEQNIGEIARTHGLALHSLALSRFGGSSHADASHFQQACAFSGSIKPN